MIKRKSTTASGSFELKKPDESREVNQPARKTFGTNLGSIFYTVQIITLVLVFMIIIILEPQVSSLYIVIPAIAFILIVDASIILIVYKRRKRAEQRSNTIAEWSKRNGLKFRSTKDFGIANRYPFNCLQLDAAYCADIVEGTFSARKICAFNYFRDVNDTFNQSRDTLQLGDNILGKYFLSAVIIETPVKFQRFQPLCVRPESLVYKAVESIGLEDIDFESIEFNNQFRVKAKDRRWAYDVVNQATMELLLASPRFIIEFQDCHVIAYRDKLFTTMDIEDALELLTGVLDNLPKSLSDEKKVERQ